jgi:hypothetical protein
MLLVVRTARSGSRLKVERGWKLEFEEPIPLPRGRQLVKLKDAATYIMKLPKRPDAGAESMTRGLK